MFVDIDKLTHLDDSIIINNNDYLEIQFMADYPKIEIFLCPSRVLENYANRDLTSITLSSSENPELFRKENLMWWAKIPTDNLLVIEDYTGIVTGITEDDEREEIVRIGLTIR